MNISDDAKNLLRHMCNSGEVGVYGSGLIDGWGLPGNNHREEAKNAAVIDELKKNKFIKSRSLTKDERAYNADVRFKIYEVTSTGYDYNDEINK